jgi:predicted kinase
MIIFDGCNAPAIIDNTRQDVIVTRGLPGSGKSTTLGLWVAADPRTRVAFGRDDVRAMLGLPPVGSRRQEDLVSAIMYGAVQQLLHCNWSVGVDATHLPDYSVRPWKDLAERYSARYQEFDYRHVSVERCIANIATRVAAGGRNVPTEVVETMAQRYGLPTPLPLTPIDY